MTWFTIRAKDRSGTIHEDRIEALNIRQAHQIIGARSWFVIQIDEESGVEKKSAPKTASQRMSLSLLKSYQLKANRKHLPMLTEQLSQLLRAGMRLSEVLEIMAKRTTDPAWAAVFGDLRSTVVGGKSLSDSMASHPRLFNELYRAMVASGEAGGQLVLILERLAEYLQRREQIRQRVVGALIYPAIIIAAGVMTVIFFMVVMLPKLSGMFKDMGRALPMSTQMLIWTSDALTRFGWLIPFGLGLGWWLFHKWLKDPAHRLAWDRSSLHWPVVGNLLSLGEYSRLMQTLATLLKSGVALVEGLLVAEATLTNTALRTAIREVRVQVRAGKSLHDALGAQRLFPGLMLDMLAVGERTGDLAGALEHTAQAYERDLDRTIRTFTTLIEPILITLMAAFVGGIVFSVLMAVFDLTSGIGKL